MKDIGFPPLLSVVYKAILDKKVFIEYAPGNNVGKTCSHKVMHRPMLI